MRTPFRESQLPTSYAAAAKRLGKRDTVRVCNATMLVRRRHNAIAVNLWDTDIVTFEPSGRILLDTGGWNTMTTRSRMMACLPGWCIWGARPKAYNVLHRIGGASDYFNRRIAIFNGLVERIVGDREDTTNRRSSMRSPRIGRRVIARAVGRAADIMSECPDIPGVDDGIVRPESIDEDRWAEVNRKFNELFRPKTPR